MITSKEEQNGNYEESIAKFIVIDRKTDEVIVMGEFTDENILIGGIYGEHMAEKKWG